MIDSIPLKPLKTTLSTKMYDDSAYLKQVNKYKFIIYQQHGDVYNCMPHTYIRISSKLIAPVHESNLILMRSRPYIRAVHIHVVKAAKLYIYWQYICAISRWIIAELSISRRGGWLEGYMWKLAIGQKRCGVWKVHWSERVLLNFIDYIAHIRGKQEEVIKAVNLGHVFSIRVCMRICASIM